MQDSTPDRGDASLEQQLEAARTQVRIFDTTLSAITDFAYTFDRDGRFLYVNQALLSLWGLTLEQAVGKDFHDLHYPEPLASRLQRQIQEVIATGKGLTDETPYTSPTGAGGFYEYIFAPVFAADGSVEVVAGSTRDISARKRTEDLLRARTAQFETLLGEAPLGVYLVDSDLRIREANPKARDLFGDVPSLIGRPLAELVAGRWPRHYADEILDHFRHTLATGEPYSAVEREETRRDTRNTEVYEWQISRIAVPDGPHGVVCYFREVSAQVAARRSLEIADRQKNEFLAMLAHELRNPLAPIRSSTEFLSRAVTDVPKAQESLGIIERQVNQLTRLVDDLLDVARISEGRIELKLKPLEISAIVAQAIEAVGPLLRERKHSVVISSSYEPLSVVGDDARLVQCIGNILTNAAKYTEPGGRIRVESRRDDGFAVISIADNGIGISKQLMPRLFELFVQGDRTLDRDQGGLGIGLAVVKRLTEMQGGSVSATSAGIGRGSTFEIRLPLVEPAVTPPGPSVTGAPVSRRVLVVDDNVDAANSLSTLLCFVGHEARAVHGAHDALAAIADFAPEVVLLDIGLPEMDGYEVARRIRAMPAGRSVRLVALTGYGQPEDRNRALAAGFDVHLVKPVDVAALEALLSEP